MAQVTPPILSYIDFHSYSQDFLYPWGYTFDKSPDVNDFIASANAGAKAIKLVNGIGYTVMQSSSLYPTSGTIIFM